MTGGGNHRLPINIGLRLPSLAYTTSVAGWLGIISVTTKAIDIICTYKVNAVSEDYVPSIASLTINVHAVIPI